VVGAEENTATDMRTREFDINRREMPKFGRIGGHGGQDHIYSSIEERSQVSLVRITKGRPNWRYDRLNLHTGQGPYGASGAVGLLHRLSTP